MKNELLLLLIRSVLAGCVQYCWVKPGATEQQRISDQMDCDAQAMKVLPPGPAPPQRPDGKIRQSKNPRPHGGQKGKAFDANISARKTQTDNCMYRKGWSRVKTDN